VLAVYGAYILLAAAGGRRRLPLQEFLTGPKQTALRPDELIVGVEWTPVEGPGSFAKVGTRNAMVIAVAGVCLQLDPQAHTVRVALGSVAPTVIRARDAEQFAAEAVPWDDPERPVGTASVNEFGRLVALAARPIDDIRGSAGYRRLAVEVLARRALAGAAAERRGAAC